MTIRNAVSGLISGLIDRLAEKVAGTGIINTEVQDQADAHLQNPEKHGGRALIARIARGEVKNYLAALAEGAEVPFTSPEQLISMLNEQAHKSFITMTPAEFASLTNITQTCDDLGHDPRIHSPSGQAEIAAEEA